MDRLRGTFLSFGRGSMYEGYDTRIVAFGEYSFIFQTGEGVILTIHRGIDDQIVYVSPI